MDEREYPRLDNIIGVPFPYGTPSKYVKYRDMDNAYNVAIAQRKRLVRRGNVEVNIEKAQLNEQRKTSPNVAPNKTILDANGNPKRLGEWTGQDTIDHIQSLKAANENLKRAGKMKIPPKPAPFEEDCLPMIPVAKGPLKQHRATVVGDKFSCEIPIPNPQWKENKPLFCTNIDGMNDFNAEEYGAGWEDETKVTQLLGKAVWHQFQKSKKPTTGGRDENTASLDNQVHATNARYTDYIMIIEKPLSNHWDAYADKEWCIVARKEAKLHPKEKAIFLGMSNVPKNVKELPMFAAYNKCKKSGQDNRVITTWRRLKIFGIAVDFQRYLPLGTIERIMYYCKLNGRWFRIPEDLKKKLIASHAAVAMGYVNTAQIISVYPKQIMVTTYSNKKLDQEYRTDAFVSANVFGDREDFMIALSTNSTFTGTLLKVKCQAGNRINADDKAPLCPPVVEPSLFDIQWKVGNVDMKCVPAAFVNLFFILKLDTAATELKEEYMDLQNPVPENAMSTCLQKCSLSFTYKNLDLVDAKNKAQSSSLFEVVQYCARRTMPIVVLFCGKNIGHTHCVAIFRDQIIDGLYDKTFPLTEENLVYTLGDDQMISKIENIYMLSPHKKAVKPYVESCKKSDDDFAFDYNLFRDAQAIRSRFLDKGKSRSKK